MTGTAKCTPHEGRHGVDSLGRCFVPARERRDSQPYRWRFVTCETCGRALDIRTDRASGVSVTLTAGTDTPHRHEPPITVQFDPDDLANAIVRASRAARQERQPQPQTPASVAVAPVAQTPMPVAAEGVIPAVAVWSPDEDGVG